MKDRIKELRKELRLTMEKFGERLGVGKTAISKLESGERNLTDQMFKAICNVNWDGRCVNEDWLRTGNGEMFVPNAGEEIEQLTKKYHLSREMKVFIEKLVNTRPEVQEALIGLITETAAGIENIKEMSIDLAANRTMSEMSRDKFHAELDRQLEEEKEAMENAPGYGRGNSGTASG